MEGPHAGGAAQTLRTWFAQNGFDQAKSSAICTALGGVVELEDLLDPQLDGQLGGLEEPVRRGELTPAERDRFLSVLRRLRDGAAPGGRVAEAPRQSENRGEAMLRRLRELPGADAEDARVTRDMEQAVQRQRAACDQEDFDVAKRCAEECKNLYQQHIHGLRERMGRHGAAIQSREELRKAQLCQEKIRWLEALAPSSMGMSRIFADPGALAGLRSLDCTGGDLAYTESSEELKECPWPAERWLELVRQAKQTGDRQTVRQLNIAVQLSTVGICLRNGYRLDDGRVRQLRPGQGSLERFHLGGERRPASNAAYGKPLSMEDFMTSRRGGAQHAFCIVVENADSIDVGFLLQEQQLNPLVLNMANAERPGGSYRIGSSAQEESLFRRTDLFCTLDPALEQQLRGRDRRNELYPQPKLGAVWSQQWVFRHGADQGYRLMDAPGQMSFLALAAERLKQERPLEPQELVLFMKKALLCCLVAAAQGHDALVLGAHGCGAFNNPPDQVAEVYKAALSCFPGSFRKVVFGVLAGGSERDCNLLAAFKRSFDEEQLRLLRGHAMHDRPPPRVAGHGCALFLCPHVWGHWKQHQESSVSQSVVDGCPWCDSAVHMTLFHHPQRCGDWSQCQRFEADAQHRRDFLHPELCPRWSGGDSPCDCTDSSRAHLDLYRHPPSCPRGPRCDQRPQCKLRHVVQPCRHGAGCAEFLDAWHCSIYSHPFAEPCRLALSCYSAACSERFAHLCPDNAVCQRTDAEHRRRWLHPDLSRLQDRPVCDGGFACRPLLSVKGHGAAACHRGELARERRLASQARSTALPVANLNRTVDFRGNMRHLKANQNRPAIPQDQISAVGQEIQCYRPVHRCKLHIFTSSLLTGTLLTRENLDILERAPQQAGPAVELVKRMAATSPQIRRLIRAEEGGSDDRLTNLGKYVEALAAAAYVQSADLARGDALFQDHSQQAKELRDHLQHISVQPRVLEDLRQAAERCAEGCARLTRPVQGAQLGCGYALDRHLGTHQHVFCVVGPHTETGYGSIVLVLKEEVLRHPDFYVTPCAATWLNQGDAKSRRPWCNVDRQAPTGSNPCVICSGACLHRPANDRELALSKLSPSIDGWSEVLAAELLGQAQHQGQTATLEGFRQMWRTEDSHGILEGHLPGTLSLDYVDRIVMDRATRDQLRPNDLQLLQGLFGDRWPAVLEVQPAVRAQAGAAAAGALAYDQTKEFAVAREPARELGFSMTLPPALTSLSRTAVLPLRLLPAEGLEHLQLRASSNSTFFVVLGAPAAFEALLDASHDPRCFVTVMVQAYETRHLRRTRACIREGLPSCPEDFWRGGEVKMEGFDDAAWQVCPEGEPTAAMRSYYLQWKDGQLSFTHWDMDAVLGRALLQLDAARLRGNDGIQVGLLTHATTVTFDRVLVDTQPPPPHGASLQQCAQAAARIRQAQERPQLHQHQECVPEPDGAPPVHAAAGQGLPPKPACRDGSQCQALGDARHCARFSHPAPAGAAAAAAAAAGPARAAAAGPARAAAAAPAGAPARAPAGGPDGALGQPAHAAGGTPMTDCRHGMQCRDLADPAHSARFRHQPKPCKFGATCTDTGASHRRDYAH